jgi:O-antigen/teichoic acid export membrane protein
MAEPRARRGLGGLLRDTASYGLGSVAVRAAQLLLVPVLTRALSPSGYGLLDLDMSIMLFVAMTLSLGLDSATWRHYYDVETPRERRSILVSALYTQLVVAVVATGALVATAPLWVEAVTGQPGQAGNVQVILAAVPCSVALGTFTTLLRARFSIARANLLAVAQLLLVGGANVTAILLHHSTLQGMVISSAIGYAAALGFGAVLLGRDLLGTWSWTWTKRLLGYGLPLVPSSVALWSLPLAGRFVVSHLQGAEGVAYLAVAAKLVAVITLAMGAFQAAWGPFALSIARQANARAVYAKALAYLVAGGVCITAALSVVARPLLHVLTTSAYADAAFLVPWLGLAAVATGAYYVTCIGASIVKKPAIITTSLLAGAAVNLVLALLLTKSVGVEGAAAASCAGLVLAAWLPIRLTTRHFPIAYTLRPVLTLVCGATALGFAGARLAPTSVAGDLLLRAVMLVALIVAAIFAAHRAGVVEALHRRLRPAGTARGTVAVGTAGGAE